MTLAPPLGPVHESHARPPRPGWVVAMGVAHILAAIFITVTALTYGLSALAMTARPRAIGAAVEGGSVWSRVDPGLATFLAVDLGSSLVLNGLMLASGVGFLNLRPWARRWWNWLAPAKVARLVLIWSWFAFAIAPGLGRRTGEAVGQMVEAQQKAQGITRPAGPPPVQILGMVYGYMYLGMAVGIIVVGSAYPLLSWWLATRPGIRRAFAEAPREIAA